ARQRLFPQFNKIDTLPDQPERFLDPPAGATAGLSPYRRSLAVPKRYVPMCPTVPLVLLVSVVSVVSVGQRPSALASANPRCRIISAALWSRSKMRPQRGQTCVRTLSDFWMRARHGEPSGRTPLQSWLVYSGGAATIGIPCSRP